MRFLLDMNLPPRWRGEFERRGHIAVHWSEIGAYTASDAEIRQWAREDGSVVFTHDLDFGTLLALTHASGPSVIQLRLAARVPEVSGPAVFATVERCRDALEKGALLTIEPARDRVRLLPLRTG